MKPSDFKSLRGLSAAELAARGLGNWNGSLFLFPVGWYDLIPEGFEVVTIGGRRERFRRGRTDDDQRFGMLAYGVVARKGGKR